MEPCISVGLSTQFAGAVHDNCLAVYPSPLDNNTPIFFLRDPLKFPDLNHAVKRDPRSNLRSANNNWDFWTSLPEALHQVTVVMSDRGIPASYRHMHGFGSHTFSFINASNERHWVKFHFRTQQGINNLRNEEADTLGIPLAEVPAD